MELLLEVRDSVRARRAPRVCLEIVAASPSPRSTGREPDDARLFLLRQRVLNRLLERRGLGIDLRREAGDHLAVAADEELLEVPADLAGELPVGFLGGQELV